MRPLSSWMGLYDQVNQVSSGKPLRSITSSTRSFQVASPRSMTASRCWPTTSQISLQVRCAGAPKAAGCLPPSTGT